MAVVSPGGKRLKTLVFEKSGDEAKKAGIGEGRGGDNQQLKQQEQEQEHRRAIRNTSRVNDTHFDNPAFEDTVEIDIAEH
eukprot:5326095-Pyramimonas_sp.AAC.1